MTSDGDPLDPPPDGPVAPDGRINVGRFAGALDEVRWGYPDPRGQPSGPSVVGWLHGQVRRALGRKRWFQAGVIAGNMVVVVRLVDHGLLGSGLVWVAELDTGRTLLEHRIPGIPLANLAVGPFAGRGTDAHASLPLARIRLYREASSRAWELTAHVPGSAVSIGLDTHRAPTPVMFVGEPSAGNGVLIQRFVGLEARGTVRIRSEVKSLESLTRAPAGFLEYGNGFFPRPLRWSTALVAGEPWTFASDLATFGDGGESAMWHGREPYALGAAELSGSAAERAPWRVATRDRRLGLSFQPRAICTESFGFGPTGMLHALVAGRFEGTWRGPEGDRAIACAGLCEARAFG